jgi:hypothetical protein
MILLGFLLTGSFIPACNTSIRAQGATTKPLLNLLKLAMNLNCKNLSYEKNIYCIFYRMGFCIRDILCL